MVVSLTEQMRVTNPEWQNFLSHRWFGKAKQKHVDMLCRLVLTKKGAPTTDCTSPPWDNAALVTPRHAVRRLWNETALLKHGKEAHRMILEGEVDEAIKGEPLTLAEKYMTHQRQILCDDVNFP